MKKREEEKKGMGRVIMRKGGRMDSKDGREREKEREKGKGETGNRSWMEERKVE